MEGRSCWVLDSFQPPVGQSEEEEEELSHVDGPEGFGAGPEEGGSRFTLTVWGSTGGVKFTRGISCDGASVGSSGSLGETGTDGAAAAAAESSSVFSSSSLSGFSRGLSAGSREALGVEGEEAGPVAVGGAPHT